MTLPPRKHPLKRSRIKKRPRSKSDFNRIYGSKERVEFVKSLPCAACGIEGYSQNAHVAGESGVGYKADAEFIAPLCAPHLVVDICWQREEIAIGCHKFFDDFRWDFDERFPDFNPAKAAAECEQKWLEYQSRDTN